MDAPAPRTLSPSHTLRGHEAAVLDCAVAADGSVAISCSADKTARVWDLSGSGTTRATLRGHTSFVWRCALSADGSVAATASWDGSVRVWDTRSGREQRVLRRDGLDIGSGCALSADGSLLVATFGSQDCTMGRVVFYDWRSDHIVDEVTRSCAVVDVSTSGDGAQVALVSSDAAVTCKVEITDRRRGLSREISCNGVADVAMTYSGSHAAIADQRQLRLLDVQGHGEPTVMQGYKSGENAFCAVTANASHVVATAPDNSYSVWDTTTGLVVAALRGHTGVSRGCAVSADGSRIITCSEDRTVRVWPMSITTAVSLGRALEWPPTAVPCSSDRAVRVSPTSITAEVSLGRALESPPTFVMMPAHSRYKTNPDIRFDLFISFYGNEIICPGISTRDLARETRDVAFEKSGELASVFFDDESVHGGHDEKRFEAILQTRGGGTVLFLLTKDFFNTPQCLNELRAILHIRARGRESDNGEKFKLRFVCFDSSADEILSHAQGAVPQLRDYHIARISRTSLEEMGNAIAKIVDRAWREDPRTLFGGSAKDSLFEVATLFRDDVTVARWELDVSGDDIHTILLNAMQGPQFGLYNVERLRKVAARSSTQMARREKEKGVKMYTTKWIDSRGWNWTVEGAIGVEYSSSG